MCHFISGLILNDFELADLNEIGTLFSITFSKCENEFVISQLSGKESYLIKDSKYCDCGTELGVLHRMKNTDDNRIEKSELEKLKQKGWSDSKIQRWISDKKKISDREKRQFNDYKYAEHADIQRWVGFINELFAKTKITKFGLMLHWYKGSVVSEKIKILNRVKIKSNDFNDQTLLQIKEDTIYFIEK